MSVFDELSFFTIKGVRYDALLDDTVVMEFKDGVVPDHLLKLTHDCYVIQCKILPQGSVRRFSRVCLPEKKFYIHPTKVLVRNDDESDFELIDVESLSQAWNDKAYAEVSFLQLHECIPSTQTHDPT